MKAIQSVITALLCAAVALPAMAQQPPGEPTMTEVRAGLYMLSWRGGNLGVSIGDDGVILIDDQYAPQVPGILDAIASVSDAPLRFVVNTHWHGDHTGGNEGMAGAGAVVIAHDNVRRRLEAGLSARDVPPAAPGALPVVTFDGSVTLHFNGTEVHAFHVPPAHTDGDSVVHFRELDVIHTGDLYFNGMYPFIDTQSGGRIDGVIAAVDRMLDLCGPETVVIPGHGPLSNCAELEAYGRMLSIIHERIAEMVARGVTEDEAVAAAPTAEFDAEWDGGFISAERLVRGIYRDLSNR